MKTTTILAFIAAALAASAGARPGLAADPRDRPAGDRESEWPATVRGFLLDARIEQLDLYDRRPRLSLAKGALSLAHTPSCIVDATVHVGVNECECLSAGGEWVLGINRA